MTTALRPIGVGVGIRYRYGHRPRRCAERMDRYLSFVYPPHPPTLKLRAWVKGLGADLRRELAQILDTPGDETIAADWIEDHGGRRRWVRYIGLVW